MTYQHQLDRAEATLGRIAATVERTENLLAAVLDTLVAMRPENMPKSMPPQPGTHMRAAFPPAMAEPPRYGPGDDDYGRKPSLLSFTNANLSPEMRAAIFAALPLPPARSAGSLHVTGPNGELPDPLGTPGAVNPDVTDDPAVLKATIGTPGWTARVRPPVAYTNALKVQVMAEYGLVGNPADFELDHLVPLCAGGNPVSQQNLWAQRRDGINGASTKDLTEVAAQHAILNGHMSLADVQRGFCEDWTKLHTALFSNPAVVRGLMAMQPPEDEP